MCVRKQMRIGKTSRKKFTGSNINEAEDTRSIGGGNIQPSTDASKARRLSIDMMTLYFANLR